MRLPGTHFWEADVPGTEQAQGWGMGAYAMWGASAFTKHSLMADVTPSASSPGLREIYCWQCGTTLMERLPSETAIDPNGTTAVMDALLAPQQNSRADG